MFEFYTVFLHAFAPLFSIVNPIGIAPVFLAMTQQYPKKEQNSLAYQVAIYGTVLLIATFFLGPHVLRFFGISLANIQVAGGMLVFYTSWKMLDAAPKISSEEKKEAEKSTDIAFFPLTMPITAGAGAMAVTIALASKVTHAPQQLMNQVTAITAILLAIIVVFILVALCYRFSSAIFHKLGHTGTNVITRLSAFILLAISIGMIWEGILGLMLNWKPA